MNTKHYEEHQERKEESLKLSGKMKTIPLPKFNVRDVLEERGNRYGEFSEHAKITQNIKRAMHDSRNWDCLTDSQTETLEMIAHKIGRILNGDPFYLDSWVDIVGYTQLVINELEKQEKENAKN